MESSVYPWQAIGRLNKAGRGHCSATVVGPKLVLTAAHCLWDKRQWTFMAVDKIHFVAGWQRGEFNFHAIAVAVHIAPGYDPEEAGGMRNLVHDWALVELETDPVPTTGVITPVPYTEKIFWAHRKQKTVFIQAGYSGDRGQVLTGHVGCPMWGFVKGLALAIHACDAVPGDSGSPIIYEDPAAAGNYLIAAVHVAHTKERVGGKGFAVPASAFLPTYRKLLDKVD